MRTTNQSGQMRYELQLVASGIQFLALLTGLIYLLTFVGGGLPILDPNGDSLAALVTFGLVLAATVGLLGAWRWQSIGGGTAVVGGVFLFILVYTVADHNKLLAAFLYSSPFVIAGSLQLLCWWQGRCAD